ncbi:hypothetical protein, partial [Klebsiella quasipneumoniae]|uniref:hypothetical protein n=1 Tax=Klebsiella quasipneumoniae TaxID=1463165 RepID=UPI001D0D76D0
IYSTKPQLLYIGIVKSPVMLNVQFAKSFKFNFGQSRGVNQECIGFIIRKLFRAIWIHDSWNSTNKHFNLSNKGGRILR